MNVTSKPAQLFISKLIPADSGEVFGTIQNDFVEGAVHFVVTIVIYVAPLIL